MTESLTEMLLRMRKELSINSTITLNSTIKLNFDSAQVLNSDIGSWLWELENNTRCEQEIRSAVKHRLSSIKGVM